MPHRPLRRPALVRSVAIEALETRRHWCGYHGLPSAPAGAGGLAVAAATAAEADAARAALPRAIAAAAAAAAGGSWSSGPPSPIPIGEAAAGVIGDALYVVSQATPATLRFDLSAGRWSSTAAAARPVAGDHHAAEVVGGKLYLVGGLTEFRGNTAPAGRVQIYDPASDEWTFGAPLPWKGGSVSTAVIGGQIYAAGGIVDSRPGQHAGTGSTSLFARYDPALNRWALLPPMPRAANHAAAGTDGRRFYVFGGRGGPNVLGNGFATAQMYDPASNRWDASDWPGRGGPAGRVAPLPVARGGTGRAAFHAGAFYVAGGETLDGPGATATGAFDRVDAYDPATRTWRRAADLPTAVHGTYAVKWSDKIYLPGGGTAAGFSQSTLLQVYAPG